MEGRVRFRVAAVVAVIATATLTLAARPASAAGPEADTASFTYVQGVLGSGGLSCSFGSGGTWSCDTPAPLVVGGLGCVQSSNVSVDAGSINLPRTGCTASLVIPSGSWPGQYNCNRGYPVGAGCQAALVGIGSAYFSYRAAIGESVQNAPATITDAQCTGDGGRATLVAAGVDISNGNVYSMASTLTWTGSCTSVVELTWTGTFSVG